MCSTKTKDINVEAFNMITNKNEAKTMKNIFHVILNANSIVQHVIQIKHGITKHINVNIKSTKHVIIGIPTHVFVRIAII